MSHNDLEDRLEEALRAVAEAVEPVAPGFDHRRTPPVVLPVEAEAGRPGSSARRSWLVAAALVLVVAVAGAVAVRAGGDAAEPSVEIAAAAGPEEQFPDGLRAPTWVPEGARLMSVGWETRDDTGRSPYGGRFQRFEDPGGTGRLIVHVMATPVASEPGATTVRGVPAAVSGAGGPPDELKTAVWTEGEQTVMAYLDGMAADAGIAFLDGLERRSGDVADGFVPPETGALRMVDEGVETSEVPPSVTTTFVYGRGADPVTDRLVIGTTARSRAPAPYMEALAEATGSDRPREFETMTEDMGRVDSMPDGTSVITTVFGAPVDGADVRRLVESVREIMPADVQRLRDEMDATSADLPLEATADLPSATVEVRGGGDFHVVCLRRSPTSARCAGVADAAARFDLDGLAEAAEGGFVVDGRWLAVAGVRDDAPTEWLSTPRTPLEDVTEAVVVSDWQISLVRVPDEVESIHRRESTTSLTRPPAG